MNLLEQKTGKSVRQRLLATGQKIFWKFSNKASMQDSLALTLEADQALSLRKATRRLEKPRQIEEFSLACCVMRNEDAGSDGFAGRLRELRKAKNLSQTDLGALAGVHYTHVGRYEKGSSRPSADTLKRLASALDTTGDFLMEGSLEEMARARLGDQELMTQFQEVERLPDEEKRVVKIFLDAFLTKRKLRQLAV